MQGGGQQQRSSWYKPRDDMDKRRSWANCGSADHHVADCTTYKQCMKSLGYAPDEEDISQTEEQEFYSGLIIKIGARSFFHISGWTVRYFGRMRRIKIIPNIN